MTTFDVLVRNPAIPPYTAVNGCVPLVRFETTKLTLGPFNVPAPTTLVPSLKVTVPVGVPKPGVIETVVAVKVTV